MSESMNDYDYWFVVPLDANGNIENATDEYVQKFKTFRAALDLATTDDSIPCTILPGWMWFNIQRVCLQCRGTGLEIYPLHHQVMDCSFCKGHGVVKGREPKASGRVNE